MDIRRFSFAIFLGVIIHIFNPEHLFCTISIFLDLSKSKNKFCSFNFFGNYDIYSWRGREEESNMLEKIFNLSMLYLF